MLDQQRQYDEDQADTTPETLEKEIREFFTAVRHALFYPPKHPIRVNSASEIWKSLQKLLSGQESHSLTAIQDKLHVDQHISDASKKVHIASDGVSMDLARRFRQRGIRSVIFSRGIEIWELEKLLDIMAMRSKDMITRVSASETLDSSGDVSHIEIVDIEYENIQFDDADGKEISMTEEEILISYLRDGSESLANAAYTYLLSLLEKTDLLAHLLEKSMYYDGTREPDSEILTRCMENLVSLGEQFADEEGRDFRSRILEATLRVERPVKKAVFSLHDDSGVIGRLMDGLSVDEITELVTLECTTDSSPIMVRRMFDELLVSYLGVAPGLLEKQLAEIEAAVQDRLIKGGQEDVFYNSFVPILEQVFVELGIGKSKSERFELEHLFGEMYVPDQGPPDEAMDLFTTEVGIVSLAFVLLEMLEFETTPEGYSEIFNQLEEIVRSLIMGSEEGAEARIRNLTSAFYIIDNIFELADPESGKPPALQNRARDAIASIGTEKIIDRVLSVSLKAEQLEWDAVEKFVQQMGEEVIPPLTEKLLSVDTPAESRKLRKILVSAGPIFVPELRELLSQCPWSLVAEYIVPALGEIGGTEALDCLSDALNHLQPQVRASAVKAMMKIRTPRAVELVLSKIRDDEEEEHIRQLAILTLGEMGNGQAVEEIGKIIKRKDTTFKHEAIQALVGIGGERSISILADILNQKRLIFGRRRIEDLQLHAVEALSQIGTQSAIKVMMEMSRKKRGNVKSALDKVLQVHHYDSED